MKVIDLTHLMTNGMPVYPGTPPAVLKSFARLNPDGFNELQIQISSHTGTHIDCPLHIIDGGSDTTATADNFYGKGIRIDCLDQGGSLEISLLQKHENALRDCAFVLLYTGWDKYWGKPGYFANFPILSKVAAAYLSRFRLKGIGIDAPSFDPVGSTELPVHNLLLGHGMILIENLTNLQELPSGEFIFSCFPLKIEKGDGCPVRATGIIN